MSIFIPQHLKINFWGIWNAQGDLARLLCSRPGVVCGMTVQCCILSFADCSWPACNVKSCLWVLHSGAASGEKVERSRDSEVMSRLHLPSFRCPVLRCLHLSWLFWLHLYSLEEGSCLPRVTHLLPQHDCGAWDGTGRGLGSSTADAVAMGSTALVWMAASSQAGCASDFAHSTTPISPGSLNLHWGLQKKLADHSVRGHLWSLGLTCCLCTPISGRSWSLPWSFILISYDCSLSMRRLEREMCLHVASWVLYPCKMVLSDENWTLKWYCFQKRSWCVWSFMYSMQTKASESSKC